MYNYRLVQRILAVSLIFTTSIVVMKPAATMAATLSLAGQLGGGCNAAGVEGNYAFIGEGPNVTVLDISTPEHPVVAARLPLPEIVQGLVVDGSRVYVADGAVGLKILDISNPLAPNVLSTYDTSLAVNVTLFEGQAYVADAFAGVKVVNVTDASNPSLASSFNTPGRALDTAILTNSVGTKYAYTADFFDSKIVIYLPPNMPQDAGTLVSPGDANAIALSGTPGIIPPGESLSGELAYIADGFSGLQILDNFNLALPPLGSIQPGGYAFEVTLSNNLAFLGTENPGDPDFHVIDVASATSPVLLGSYDTPGDSRAIIHSGTGVYVAALGGGFHILDVANPSTPELVGSYINPGNVVGVYAEVGLAYLATEAGLQIVDFNSPSTPVLLGSLEIPGSADNIVVSGTAAYVVGTDTGLQIIDISNPSSPQVVGSYFDPMGGAYLDLKVADGRAYLASNVAGLRILDVSNPANPQLLGSYDTPGIAFSVFYQNQKAYLGDTTAQGAGLIILDVSDTANPQLLGSYDTPGNPHSVFVSGNLAFIADSQGDLQIVNVSNPASPQFAGSQEAPGFAEDVFAFSNRVYLTTIGNPESGLHAYDITNPATPVMVATFPTAGNARGLFAIRMPAKGDPDEEEDDEIYLADGYGGIDVFDYLPDFPTPGMVDTETPTPTPTSTETFTRTPTPTRTVTETPGPTLSETPTGTVLIAPTFTFTSGPTPTSTRTPTVTVSPTPRVDGDELLDLLLDRGEASPDLDMDYNGDQVEDYQDVLFFAAQWFQAGGG
jgi:hypothetical protein